MEKNSIKHIRKMIIKACKPLIIMAIENGFTAKQFNEAINYCYVSIASERFGIKGRPANRSRIAILTGISRKEIKRTAGEAERENGRTLSKATPIGRFLAAWHNDHEYIDDDGKPIPLSYEGQIPSFEALAKKYIGDIPPSALLKELERNNLVTEDQTGKVFPLAQVYIPDRGNFHSIDRLGEVMGELGGTIVKNLEKSKDRLFERRVLSGSISEEQVHKFHKIVEQQGSKFLKFLEAWLFERGLSDTTSTDMDDSNRAGVGVYFFKEDGKDVRR